MVLGAGTALCKEPHSHRAAPEGQAAVPHSPGIGTAAGENIPVPDTAGESAVPPDRDMDSVQASPVPGTAAFPNRSPAAAAVLILPPVPLPGTGLSLPGNESSGFAQPPAVVPRRHRKPKHRPEFRFHNFYTTLSFPLLIQSAFKALNL